MSDSITVTIQSEYITWVYVQIIRTTENVTLKKIGFTMSSAKVTYF